MMSVTEIREQMERRPFRPFTIRTTDGQAYRVESHDHLMVTPTQKSVVVGTLDAATGEEHLNILPVIHICGMTVVEQART